MNAVRVLWCEPNKRILPEWEAAVWRRVASPRWLIAGVNWCGLQCSHQLTPSQRVQCMSGRRQTWTDGDQNQNQNLLYCRTTTVHLHCVHHRQLIVGSDVPPGVFALQFGPRRQNKIIRFLPLYPSDHSE